MRTRLLALTLALTLAACGGDDASSDAVENTGGPKTGIGQAMQGMGALKDMAEQMEEAATTAPAEPVNHRVLAEMLPEAAAGFAQTETSGETNSMGGAFSVSERSATYQTEGEDGRLVLKVMDLGGLPNVAMFGAPWAMMDVDKESGSSYERTITYQGHRGHRTYDTERRTGELSVLVEGRYIVTVTGRDVEDGQMEEALQAVDTRRLASMKDEGRASS